VVSIEDELRLLVLVEALYMRNLSSIVTRVEVFITDHLRDYTPNLEKYKAVQKIPYRKIENKRNVIFLISLIFKIK
jgi:hypothetical protein